MPPNRNKGSGGPTDIMDEDISFPLARLFDRFNLDHIPEKKRMEEFEYRDLAHIKHYKAAVKIFGGPLSRKRVMVAPPMELPIKHRLGLYAGKRSPPPAPTLNSELKPQPPAVKPEPEELVLARQAREREDKYKSWFKERQKFRNDLENMGLNSDWLSNKPNKTVLEKRVLKQLKEKEGKEIDVEEDSVETPDQISREYTSDSDSSILPHLKIPAPLGLKILDDHLKEKKLRLIDLFTSTDKNKDWRLSRDEFIKSCEERSIPISRGLLEDMLISLDMNLDEELDYKEMARGMKVARQEKREDRRKELSRESTSMSQRSGSRGESANGTKPEVVADNRQMSPASRKTGSTKLSDKPKHAGKDSNKTVLTNTSSIPVLKDADTTNSSKSRKTAEKLEQSDKSTIKSFGSKFSKHDNQSVLSTTSKGTKSNSDKGTSGPRSERTSSPSYLEPPLIDTKPDRLILASEEAMVDLRKHDREALKGYNAKIEGVPPTILTGSKAIDDHCMQSTLTGDVGEMTNKFRQKRLQEYFEISKLCHDNDVVLSQQLLEKVLLYPGDKAHSDLRKLRHPDSAPLVSSHFADPPKRPRTPIEVKHKDKVRRSKSGKLLIDSRHKYPMSKNVSADAYKQNLSTGRAVIRRRVDCWMTFEQYEKLTRHLAIRYQHLHGSTDGNAFWPGHLLDKVRLCMPPYDQPGTRDKEAAIYRRVHRTPAVNYGYDPVDVWPINDSLITQIGIHDHFRNKTII
ncbi:EF-hand calcium-binding domain-containing protein 12-like [Mercenaria mercenaria]|uniref:EF-hand calcium-binding domain-containing protein 12-like n=1 Tax=Mercenaria mercenaria TaxID=6596 RepID=UPI00234E72BC|nr:EF-hand calcium-binding domain-containing protein 12-like [Mercenaria mercenaria]XP_053378026.1 EF-hand calcium-binding domain-containing protein 12-like [Mercenaria mercenaria]XP_053378027.1 EF-hand calcium-binding domain-containing protein 12-like [Mercenaria mercenaria]